MVPDLPYVRKDVPDGSETPENAGRLAHVIRSIQLRVRVASKGMQDIKASVNQTGTGPRLRTATAVLAMGLSSALAVGLYLPAAQADELTDRRAALQSKIAQTKSDLGESSAALSQAAVAVDAAQDRLETAQVALAETRDELATAVTQDREMAAKLTKAKADLAKAKAAVVAGQAKIDKQKALAGDMVRDQYQQQTNLLPVAAIVDSSSTADLATRLQWATTMFDTTQGEIDQLTVLQRTLNASRATATNLEVEVAADRKTAADNLVVRKQLEAQATRQEASVANLVTQRQAAEQAAAADVASDKKQYAELESERASVEQRIAERIARAKAEAARKAREAKARAEARAAAQARAEAAERRAEAAREKAARARAKSKSEFQAEPQTQSRSSHSSSKSTTSKAKKSKAKSSKKHSSSSSRSAGTSSATRASHGFIYPVKASITSKYGMRFHPVLHYWKLHDGTDFGASCGAPIRAAYSGRVAEKYYNAGYGNRLMIDHGMVDGRYVTTGYNHAIRYTVGVGDRVSKGEVIGYVGTTGYSTGCHLHLMVWLDGGRTNPMSWF